MAKRTWTLTDVDRDLFVEEVRLTPTDVEGVAEGYSLTKRTLRGGLRDGVDVIEVDNGLFRFVVVPTRGMGLWRGMLGDISLGWQSPVKGPVHPSLVRLTEASGLGWLDGFDELLCRCGLESNGAPEFAENGSLVYGLHGKIANCPAHKTEVTIDGDSGEIVVTGVVDESRLFCNKLRMTSTIATKLGQPGLTIRDTVTNISAQPGELQLLYHINFGVPLLEPGAKLVAPVVKMAPRDPISALHTAQWATYQSETPGVPEQCMFFELAAAADGRTQVLLHNAAGSQGVGLAFDKRQLPCFTQWKNHQPKIDGYVTGLEPATNFPNRRSFEKSKGRVVVLEPGQSRSFEVTMEVYPDAASVDAARGAVEKLQEGVTPKIADQPDPDFAP